MDLNYPAFIPWVLGIGAWFVARRQNAKRPIVWALVAVLVGGAISLALR